MPTFDTSVPATLMERTTQEVHSENATRCDHQPARQVLFALHLYLGVMVAFLVGSWVIYLRHATFDRRPLFASSDEFGDLFWYQLKTLHLQHSSAALGRGIPIFAYSPPAAFLWHLLFMFPGHRFIPYLTLVVLLALALTIVGTSAIGIKGRLGSAGVDAIRLTALLGWPLFYVIDRGNLEGIVWAVTGTGLCFLLRGKSRAAAVCIGLAASIKPFPLAFAVLLVLKRKYREATLAIMITAVLVLAAYIGIGPNPWKAYQDLKPGFHLYNRIYLQTIRPVDEVRLSHSILDGSKLLAAIIHTRSVHPSVLNEQIARLGSIEAGWAPVRLLASVYPLMALLLFGTAVNCARSMPTLNQVTIFALCATLLPPNSFEYTLLNLYVPFGAFVVFLVRDVATGYTTLRSRILFAIVTIYGLLFAPLSFLRVYAGVAKLLLLILLLVLIIRTPMPSAYFAAERDQLRNPENGCTQ
jgi:hypothetical protein